MIKPIGGQTAGAGRTTLTADDGAGLDLASVDSALERGHIGLASSAERAESVGGHIEVNGCPGEGTLIRTVLPLDRDGSAEDAAAHRLGDRG